MSYFNNPVQQRLRNLLNIKLWVDQILEHSLFKSKSFVMSSTTNKSTVSVNHCFYAKQIIDAIAVPNESCDHCKPDKIDLNMQCHVRLKKL